MHIVKTTMPFVILVAVAPLLSVHAQAPSPLIEERAAGGQRLPFQGLRSAVEADPSPAELSDAQPPGGGGFELGSPGGPPGGGGPGGPMGGPPGYDAVWYPAQSVRGQDADFGFVRQGFSVAAPVWRGRNDMLMASLGVRNTLFSTDAILPDSRRPFPDQLWSLNVGLQYMHQFDNGWSGGLLAGFGSASDKPFHSIDEVTTNLGVFLRVPVRNGRDSWQFSLRYMSSGPVNFPLPLVAYGWNPSAQLRVNIGLPFSVFWQPSDALTLNFSYMPLNNVNARLTYRLAPHMQVYGGYEFLNESYFLANRADTGDRFFGFEQRLVSGLRWEVWKTATVELHGGYSFDRRYGEGQSQWESLSDRLDVAPGAFVGMHFRLRF